MKRKVNVYICGMAGVRTEKIASLLKRELSLIFQQQGPAYLQGAMISVTQVRVSADLGNAKIYVSIFPSEKRDEGMKALQTRLVHTRHLLAIAIGKQVRKIPDLQFFIDDSLDYAEEIDRLLKNP
jgi:ribosome-binding factor A